jgi:hypothetical protein
LEKRKVGKKRKKKKSEKIPFKVDSELGDSVNSLTIENGQLKVDPQIDNLIKN